MQRGNAFVYTEDPGRGQRRTDSDNRIIMIEIDGPVYDDLYFEMARWRKSSLSPNDKERPVKRMHESIGGAT